jgi:hypothetical protein
LEKIKQRFRKNVKPDEYHRGTFWLNPPLPCFALQGEADPNQLYLPRVCIWFPYHLTKAKEDLKCPTCGEVLQSKGISSDPIARKIIDIEE